MHWIRELLGCHVERWPVEFSIGDATPVVTEFVHRLTDYTAARPGLDIALPGEAVIEAMATVAPIRVEARGTDLRLVSQFNADWEHAKSACGEPVSAVSGDFGWGRGIDLAIPRLRLCGACVGGE